MKIARGLTKHATSWLGSKSNPRPLAPKAAPEGPTASATCLCVSMRMRRNTYLSAVIAVRSSCQDHVG
jgi:hypothetical protein